MITLRIWTRCEKGRKNDMEPFFATREVKKFGLEGGLLCLYECVFGVLQLRKIPKRASSVFPSNPLCQKSLLWRKTDQCFLCLSPVCFCFTAYKEREWDQGKEEDDERERERVMSLYKRTVLMVFSIALFFCFFLLRAYHVWGHFDRCFLLLLPGLCNQYYYRVFYFVHASL